MKIRVKVGLNMYNQRFTCSCCSKTFEGGTMGPAPSLYLRLFAEGDVVIAICPSCVERIGLFEGEIDLDVDNPSHLIGVA